MATLAVHGASFPCDIEAQADSSKETYGYGITSVISVKGFCVLDCGIAKQRLEAALASVSALEADGLFAQPPVAVTEGLLGVTGSGRIAELPPTRIREGNADLDYLDTEMTEFGAVLMPYLPSIGVEVKTRTPGLLHEAGLPPGEGPALTEDVCAKWLSTFSNHRIMFIWCLGPGEGTLELQPLDDESNGHRVTLSPGALVVLRADAMSHRLSSSGKVHCLTCFFQKDVRVCKHNTFSPESTPCCKALEDWAEARLLEHKESDPEERTAMAPLPRQWELWMNHTIFTGQHVSVRSASTHQPASWQVDEWVGALYSGPDFMVQIPLVRFDYELTYDPHPDSWNWYKHCSKHGAFLEGTELFDNTIFRISRSEAVGMDVGHRLTLETGYAALVADGYKVSMLMGSRGGVYVANPPGYEWGTCEKQITGSGVCGGGGSIACGRFSFVHGMKGPCISVDVEAASSLVAANFATINLSRTGNWSPIPFALLTSWNLLLQSQSYLHYSAMGVLAPEGRVFTFDASGQGFVRGECSTSLVLKAMTSLVDDEVVVNEEGEKLGALAGSAVNQSGKRASFTAPDGISQQQVMLEALRQADISPLDADCVETSCDAQILYDAIEASFTAKAYRPENTPGIDETPTVALQSIKTSLGNQLEAAGLAQILRVCVGATYGAMHPNLHQRILNPHMDLDLCDRPAHIGTEALEFRMSTCFTGVTNRSMMGTNTHCLVFAQLTDENSAPLPEPLYLREKILYWPDGGGTLPSEVMPKRGYYIAGSFNNWKPELMQTESPNTFGFVVTVGENRWERFHILLDGDSRRVLCPGTNPGASGDPLTGPKEAFRCDSWMIGTGADSDITGDIPSPGVGHRYHVHLRVAGKWRTVDWEKVVDEDDRDGSARKFADSKYWLVGTWNDGQPEEMLPDPAARGRYTLEVTLTAGTGMFYVIRNMDWEQAICPVYTNADASAEVTGPAENTGDMWYLHGHPGDVFLIEFQRASELALDLMKVSWRFVRRQDMALERMNQSSRTQYFISGTWDGGQFNRRMNFIGDYFQFYVILGKKMAESFRIFQNGLINKCVYPSQRHANPHVKHELIGPDAFSAGTSWTIGHNDNDQAMPGRKYEVRLFVDEDLRPERLDWKPVTSMEGLEDAKGRGFLVHGR